MNLIFLWKKLYALKMKEGDRVINHLNAFNAFLNQSRVIDDEVKGNKQAKPCFIVYWILKEI